jgi:methylmalonyl-CoA/ethylmalonyl-CoA epimerase
MAAAMSTSRVSRIDHLAIVVDDIDKALEFWRDGLGLEISHVEEVPEQGAIVTFLTIGGQNVELVKPTDDESGMSRFLEKRGPGMHHIAFEVENIEDSLDHLRSAGIRLIHDEPVLGAGGRRIAFVHPESTHGVLVELYEMKQD